MDIKYIERILKLRQELIDDNTFNNKKVEDLDRMFENFMDINYKINIKINLSENIFDIMSKLVRMNEM